MNIDTKEVEVVGSRNLGRDTFYFYKFRVIPRNPDSCKIGDPAIVWSGKPDTFFLVSVEYCPDPQNPYGSEVMFCVISMERDSAGDCEYVDYESYWNFKDRPDVVVTFPGKAWVSFVKAHSPYGDISAYVYERLGPSSWMLRYITPSLMRTTVALLSAEVCQTRKGPAVDIWLAYDNVRDLYRPYIYVDKSWDSGRTWIGYKDFITYSNPTGDLTCMIPRAHKKLKSFYACNGACDVVIGYVTPDPSDPNRCWSNIAYTIKGDTTAFWNIAHINPVYDMDIMPAVKVDRDGNIYVLTMHGLVTWKPWLYTISPGSLSPSRVGGDVRTLTPPFSVIYGNEMHINPLYGFLDYIGLDLDNEGYFYATWTGADAPGQPTKIYFATNKDTSTLSSSPQPINTVFKSRESVDLPPGTYVYDALGRRVAVVGNRKVFLKPGVYFAKRGSKVLKFLVIGGKR